MAETQTETFNTHSDSICCLNSIPYVDQSISPPVVHKVIENCTENHLNESIPPFTIDSSISAATQTAIAITTATATTQLDNGDVPHDNGNCNEIL
ncbi:hypothetical protein PVAND_014552 [Polypedilum vanderplanki]|uniref:Uncharacterized protein n=1 Tax=Polypedilum vanderplanki TaxID=319348 RepID=A0A9J6B9Q8_POLVA|nr:hypothetical protein PVAND_014552 [Polypedilum vanderplanki]